MSNFFLLEEGAKVGVYGNGDTVYGTTGTQKALIMEGATNVNVLNTVEEIHLRGNMEDVRFTTDPNTLTVNIVVGGNTVASFTALESGMKLFTANGMTVIKPLVDTATGTISFTADNGATGATPVALPTDATALPADAIDANQKSDNAGGSVTPPADDTPTVDLDKGDAIPATGAYNLIGSVDNLGKLTTAQVEGATTITAKDGVDNLLKTDVVTKAVLAFTDNVTVEDTLQKLALADLSGLTSPKLVVKSVPTDGKVTLTEAVKVDYVQSANEKLDAFLARTDVDYTTYKLTKPESLTLDSYSIEDTAASVAGATAKVLADADSVTVKDTMSGFEANLAVADNANVDKLTVADSLTHILSGGTVVVKGLINNAASFIANDTPDAKGVVSADASALASFQYTSTSTEGISFSSNADVKAINLTATKAVGESGKELDLSKIFADAVTATVNFTGSTGKDYVKADAVNGTVINGGGGEDTITLVANNTATVVLGSDNWTPANSKPDATADGSNAVTINTFTTGKHTIDFGGMFADFAHGSGTLNSAADQSATTLAKNTFYAFTDANVTAVKDFTTSLNGKFVGLSKGEGAVVAIIDGTSAAHIYYVEEVNNDNKINFANDLIVKLADITGEFKDTDFAA